MSAIVVGKFDALHLGHRLLVERAPADRPIRLLGFTGMATELGWEERLPLVAPDDRPRILASWAGDRDLAETLLPFLRVRHLDAAAFIALLRDDLHASALVVGQDFRCGRGRSAGIAELAPLCAAAGLLLLAVPPLLLDGAAVSSSRIRQALEHGDVAQAATLLGRPHRLCGTVVRGDGRGQALGFPTANLGERANLHPAPGVYAAQVTGLPGAWRAAVNIGHLPTVGAARPLTVEAHLPGFAGDLYGRALGLDLLARLRDEQRFANLDDLRAQLVRDVAAVASV